MVVGGSLLRTVAVAGDRQLVSSDVLCGDGADTSADWALGPLSTAGESSL